MAVVKTAGPIGLAIFHVRRDGVSAGLRKPTNFLRAVVGSEPLQKRVCSMDNRPKTIEDYNRPAVFVYHKHAVSGRLYGVLHYTQDMPGPDNRHCETKHRFPITDEDWKEFCRVVGSMTLIGFLTKRYPPPVDKEDIVLTVATILANEEASGQIQQETSQ